jgi:hypothetical protein
MTTSAGPGTIASHPNSAEWAAAVTPSDSATFPPTRGLRVGTAGDVTVLMSGDGASGTPVLIPAVLAGELLPIRVTKVMSTGTTASGITALW